MTLRKGALVTANGSTGAEYRDSLGNTTCPDTSICWLSNSVTRRSGSHLSSVSITRSIQDVEDEENKTAELYRVSAKFV